MTFLVTGAAGFIGSHFCDLLVSKGHKVIALDKITYAGTQAHIPAQATFVRGNICDEEKVAQLLDLYMPDAVFNFAAESHVCRSIEEPATFIESNIRGTFVLLQECLKYWKVMPAFRYIQVSTDEVFGDLGPNDAPFTEASPYRPNSPYSASKAAADHLVRSWHRTYGLPTIITHCSNNYGTRQNEEKLIPKVIGQIRRGEAVTLHGDGSNVRDWIHVSDHCMGIWLAYLAGKPGRSYCFGGECELSNEQVVDLIARNLPQITRVTYGQDRPGNDRRYALNCTRAWDELGWHPEVTFEDGLRDLIRSTV